MAAWFELQENLNEGDYRKRSRAWHEHSAETQAEGHAAYALLAALDSHFAGDFDAFIAPGLTLDGTLSDVDKAKQAVAIDGLVQKEICAGIECVGEGGTVRSVR